MPVLVVACVCVSLVFVRVCLLFPLVFVRLLVCVFGCFLLFVLVLFCSCVVLCVLRDLFCCCSFPHLLLFVVGCVLFVFVCACLFCLFVSG